jgi:hypothetical protein
MKYNNQTITLREVVPIVILRRIVRFYDQLPLRQESIAKREDKGPYIDSLRKYLAAMEAGHGNINIQYQQVSGIQKGKVGRYFAELKMIGTSLQGMPREIRHTLAKDTWKKTGPSDAFF